MLGLSRQSLYVKLRKYNLLGIGAGTDCARARRRVGLHPVESSLEPASLATSFCLVAGTVRYG